jgi:hypothetical protein
VGSVRVSARGAAFFIWLLFSIFERKRPRTKDDEED